MSELFQSDQLQAEHPNADELSAFVEHTLPDHEHREMLIHLADCAACRNVVSLSLPPVEEPSAFEHAHAFVPPPAGGLAGWKLATARVWVAGSAVAALIVFMVYLQARTHGRNAVTSHGEVAAARESSKPAAPPILATSKDASTSSAQPSVPAPVASSASSPDSKATVSGGARSPLVTRRAGTPNAPPAPVGAVASEKTIAGKDSAGGIASKHGVETTQSRKFTGTVQGMLGASSRQNGPASHSTNAPQWRADPQTEADTVAVAPATVTAPVSARAALPSGLPAISVAAKLTQRLAIDTGNQIFLSNDGGRRWNSVAATWQGRATAVSRVTLVAPTLSKPSSEALAFAVPERYTPGETAVIEADTSSNTLSGRISSASGTAIARARISLTDSRTGLVRTIDADGTGSYLVANFVPGLYRIDTLVPGFQKQSLLVDLSTVSQAVRNITLNAGQVTQTVNVEASNAPLQTESQQNSDPALKSRHSSDSSPLTPSPRQVFFAVTTDLGERWVSLDGQDWKRE